MESAPDRCSSVSRRLLLPWRETRIALPRLCGSVRVDLFHVIDDRLDGAAEAVEVEAVDRAPWIRRKSGIVLPEPLVELKHFHVPPHPGRKPRECRLSPRHT